LPIVRLIRRSLDTSGSLQGRAEAPASARASFASFRSALSYSYIENYGSFVIGLVATIVISRILGPAEIGAFSIGVGLVGVIAVIREMGVGAYIVQEESLTDGRIRAAFTILVALGSGLGLAILGLSWPAGRLYGSEVARVVAILSLGFAITPLGGVAQALMARDLQFGRLSWIRFLHGFVAASVGIVLASLGFGPEGLAWASVASALSNAALSTVAKPHRWRPNFSRRDWKRIVGVGGPAAAASLVEDVASALPELLLGRLQNLAAAGLFSRARGLSQTATQAIAGAAGPVVLCEFALRNRGGVSLDPFYRKATLCVTALGWSGLGVLALLAEPAVRVLFGSQWTEVVPLVRWLCVAAAVALLTAYSHQALLASGGALAAMRARLAWLPIHFVCLLLGALGGPDWIAAGMVLSSIAGSALLCAALRRRIGIVVFAHLRIAKESAPIAFSATIGALPSLLLGDGTLGGSILALLAGGVGAIAGFLAAARVTGHPVLEELIRMLGSLRARTRPGV